MDESSFAESGLDRLIRLLIYAYAQRKEQAKMAFQHYRFSYCVGQRKKCCRQLAPDVLAEGLRFLCYQKRKWMRIDCRSMQEIAPLGVAQKHLALNTIDGRK